MSSVTIGFVPRERFSCAAESLQRIIELTEVPFELIVVDCNTPPEVWAEMEAAMAGHDDVRVIRRDEYLLPNQAKNLVIQEATGEYLCLIENDNLVETGWVTKLIAACEEYPADVAIPLLYEGRPGRDGTHVHFDDALGSVQKVQTPEGERIEIVRRPISRDETPGMARRREEFMETHCLLFRRSVFDRIGPWDEGLNAGEEVDVSLALYHADIPAVFEPNCVIHYITPTFPLEDVDLGYFLTKWNVEGARRSHARMTRKWGLHHFPQVTGFIEERNLRGQGRLREALADIAGEKPFVLVDSNQWVEPDILADLHPIPFLERDGEYYGAPADDEEAIAEFERLRKAGAGYIVFTWNCFWWFEVYEGFARYLRERYATVRDDDLIVAFDLDAERKRVDSAA